MRGIYGAVVGGAAVLGSIWATGPVPLTASIAAETTATATVLWQPGTPVQWTVTGPVIQIPTPPAGMAPPAYGGGAAASSGNQALRLLHIAPTGIDKFAVYYRPAGSVQPWGMVSVPAGSDVWVEIPGPPLQPEIRLASYVGPGDPPSSPPP